MIALICDSWENFWREVLSPWGEIKTFSDGVTLAYYLPHGGTCDMAVVADGFLVKPLPRGEPENTLHRILGPPGSAG